MKLVDLLRLTLAITFYLSCRPNQSGQNAASMIATGQMPNLATDKTGNVYLVYGHGDSIMYASSVDHGESFSKPSLVATLPKLFATAMRGPQIAITDVGVIILASDQFGDIFSFRKDESGGWTKNARVNDVDTVAKEGLMALSGDDDILYAVWLDLRGNKHNKIVGAKSIDGGKTWSKNMMIYTSPDSSVCECCKPAVAVKGNHVNVMFRNWLNGNRDLYLIQSDDGGNHFGTAEKLGTGSWPLNGCPMDGGGVAINASNHTQTVWRRQNKIFACEPGKPEIEIGEGRSCSIESVNDKNVYAWTKNGKIILLKPSQEKISLGDGSLPLIKSIGRNEVICVWENESKIYSAIVPL